MIVEDAAVVAVIVLFAWLVPARQNGIPGLGGRGRIPARAVQADPAVTETRPKLIRPRPVPAAEQISPPGTANAADRGDRAERADTAGQRGRDHDWDARVLAELDKTWAPGYADRVAAQVRERKGRR
ncbi:MAG TPA: hypothetical protein VGI00_05840 [Streptosporangiaceae bacterium]|jgi:hypothetical protein